MIRNDIEKAAIKKALLFCKEDIVKYLNNCIEETCNEEDIKSYEELLRLIKNKTFIPIEEKLDSDYIHCYIHNTENNTIEEGYAEGLHFTYL